MDSKYKLPAKPKLVLVPDSEIQMVSISELFLVFDSKFFYCRKI